MKLQIRHGTIVCLLLGLSMFAIPTIAFGQSGSITGTGCFSVDVTGRATVGIQLVGSWSGTIQPKAAIGGQAAFNVQVTPAASTTPQSTITANDGYIAAVSGYSVFQLCGNTVTGTARFYFNATQLSSLGHGGGGGGGGGGTTINPTDDYYPKRSSSTIFGDSCLSDDGSLVTNHCAGGYNQVSSLAGIYNIGQGTAQGITANKIGLTGGTSIIGYNILFPPAAGTGIFRGVNASNIVTGAWSELSGDCATSGSNVVLCTKINGIAISGTPAIGYVPTATSPSAASWQANSGGVSGLTLGFLSKAASASTLADSLCDEGITTANTFTCVNSAGMAGVSWSGTNTSVAGFTNWGQGTKPPAGTTAITEYAPTSVTSYFLAKPGTGVAGIMHWTCSGSPATCTESLSGVAIADLSATGTPSSSTFLRGDNTWAAATCATCVVASSPGAGIAHFAGATQTVTSSPVVGADMTNNTVGATQLAAQYSKGQCTEVWGGTGTSNALASGDDAISNNTCYNDSGVTRTITAVKCRSDNASNTTTAHPTFGAAGTGTTILSGAVTCGSSLAYSSTGTVSNASWTTGTGINPVQGGTLTGTSIALLIEYTF